MKIFKEEVALVSDFHIGAHQSSINWHTTALNYARYLKEELIKLNIKDIIIAGDVLDDRNEISVLTLHYLTQFFQILDCFNIIILVGNHDCYYSRRSDVHSIKSLNNWENIKVIDTLTTITFNDKIITFCPWNTAIEQIPKSDIIIGHFDIQTFKMSGQKINEHGVKSQELLQKAKLIITGHYHLTQDRVYQNGTILYIGSPYELNWGEANTSKGFYTLNLESLQYTFIENTFSPKHRRVRLSELLKLGKITEQIKKEFQGNIISFVVDIDANQQIIDNLVQKFSLLKPLEMKIEYDLTQTVNIVSMSENLDVLGINVESDIIEFVRSMESIENKEEVIKYLSDVYKRVEVYLK